jgi:hypothetical protein
MLVKVSVTFHIQLGHVRSESVAGNVDVRIRFLLIVTGALAMNSRLHTQHHVWRANEDHMFRLHHLQYMTPPVKAYENHFQSDTKKELLTLSTFQSEHMRAIRDVGMILEIGVAC